MATPVFANRFASLPNFWLIAPFLLGTALRLWYLHDQPLLDDEVAAVRHTLALGPAQLLVTFDRQDIFRPVAAVARWLLERGVPLNEWTFRAPAVVAGLAALLVLPAAVERRYGRSVANLFAWLLVVSPMLVLYSRIARSYLPAALLSALAVLRLTQAQRSPDRRPFLEAALLSVLAAWSLLLSVPFLAGAFFAVAIRVFLDRTSSGTAARANFAIAAATAGALALLFFAPGSQSLARLIELKAGGARMSLESWSGAVRYLAGSRHALVAAAFVVLAVVGCLVMWKRAREDAAIWTSAVAAQLAGVIALSPFGSENSPVAARYQLVSLPVLLLWIAFALDATWKRSGATLRPALLAPIVAVLLFVSGPIPAIYAAKSSLAHHGSRLRYLSPTFGSTSELPEQLRVPLARNARVFAWVVPNLTSRNFSRLETIDRTLRRRIVLVDMGRVARAEGVRFRNVVPPNRTAVRATGADVLVMDMRDSARAKRHQGKPADPEVSRRRRERFLGELIREFGRPSSQDRMYSVWDLSRSPRGPRAKKEKARRGSSPGSKVVGAPLPGDPES